MKKISYTDQILTLTDLNEEFWQWIIDFLPEVKWTNMDNALCDIRLTDAHP